MKPRKPIRRTPLKRKPFKLTAKLDDVLHYVWGKPVCIAAKKYSRMKPKKSIRRTPLKRKFFRVTYRWVAAPAGTWDTKIYTAAQRRRDSRKIMKQIRDSREPISKKALWKQIADRHASNMRATTALEHLARKPLRRETPKRASEQRRYRRDSQAWLRADNRVCIVCLKLKLHPEPATQTHHKYGKRGRLLNWQPGWMGVSSFGQFWIHNHPTQAYKLGLLGPVGTWNDFERAVKHFESL